MKYLAFLICATLLITCGTQQDYRSDAIGKYSNAYELGAEHHLHLMENDSFRHVYTGSLGHFVNVGKWSTNSNGTTVFFARWKSFGKNADPYCTGGCPTSVEFDGRELYFDYDLPERNFYKQE